MKKETLFFIFIMIFSVNLFSQSKYISEKEEEKKKNTKPFFSLPGVKEKIDTEDIIQKLLYVKQIPIEQKKLEAEDYKIENSIIKDFSGYLRNLDEKSRKLFDYQSPFREMEGVSPNPDLIEVFATRKAKKQDYNIKINQIARPDSFASDSIPRNKVLPPSEFTVYLGKEKIPVIFKGGTIYQLYETLKEANPGLLDVRIINDTPTTAILVITGKKTGKENKIYFDGKLDVLLEIGMLTKSQEKKFDKPIYFDNVNVLSGSPVITKTAVSLPENTLIEKPLKENINENYFLSLDFDINYFGAEGERKSYFTNENGELVLMEPVQISNVVVSGGSLILDIEEKPKEVISNFIDYIVLHFTNGEKFTLQFQTNGNFKFSLEKFNKNQIEKITIENKNTDREIKVANVRIFSELEERKFTPKNPITKACDAIFELDGVEIKRDKNNIDDVIDGVTLNLKGETTSPIKVSVDYNYKKIEEAILDWIDAYNKTMEYLYILTEPTLDKTPLHERKPEDLKRGIYQAENSFISLRNKLRQIPGNSYKTDYGRELTVLEQIGIYTKRTGTFSAQSDEWTSAKMGLLQIDLEKFRGVLKTRLNGVEQIFANDLDGDLFKDSGVAVNISQSLKTAIGKGSFIEMKIANNERKIREKEKDVEEMNKKLAEYEIELRKKYGKLNQALMESEAKQKWLNNQFKNND
jgi:flagellar hook-associated protein 2